MARGRLPLLDLGCGAGGASWGYWLSGLFRPVGVDIAEQPDYPFMFLRMDVRELDPERIADDFAAIHISMPCQRWSTATKRNGTQANHPDLVSFARDLALASGLPYVMENIPAAPLVSPVLCCGSGEGIVMRLASGHRRLRRHRHFESNVEISAAFAGCGCKRWASVPVLDVTGGGNTTKPRVDGKGGRPSKGTADEVRLLMGMQWATKEGCNEAIPPLYTQRVAPFLYAGARDRITRMRRELRLRGAA